MNLDGYELKSLCDLISDALGDISLWLNCGPSTQERRLLASMSQSLHQLKLIFWRIAEGWPAHAEDGDWEDHASEFTKLLGRVKTVRGNTVGNNLDVLDQRLIDLPGLLNSASINQSSTTPSRTPNARRVDAFIQRFDASGHRITRTDIYHVAGYDDRSQFLRWQKGDERSTPGDANKFSRVLDMAIPEFMQRKKNYRPKDKR